MDIHTLFAALKPELHKVTLKTVQYFIFIDQLSAISKSALMLKVPYSIPSVMKTVSLFSLMLTKTVNIDALIVAEINNEVMKLWPKADEPQIQDQIEKK